MNDKIRVMQLIWQLSTGGGEKVVLNLLESFKNDPEIETRAFTFYPFAGRQNEIYAEDHGLNVTYIEGYKGEKLPVVLKRIYLHFTKTKQREKWLQKEIDDYKPDIIHVHVSNLGAELYNVLKDYAGKCYIIYHMHSMPEAVKEERKKVIRKALANGTYHPVGVTKQQIESAKKIYGYDRDIPLVYNGIDEGIYLSNDFKLSVSKRTQLRESLKIGADDFVVGCVGRLNKIKNHILLVQAFGKIIEKDNNAKLLLVGEVDHTIKTQLLEVGDKYKNNIIFTGNQSNVYKYYSIMDVFALASFYESSSIASVEAQLSGIPCVLSNAVSDEVIISDGVVRVSPFASSEDWAKEIIKLRGKSINLVDKDRFDINCCMHKMKKIYMQSLHQC